MIKNQIPDFILVRFTPLRSDPTVKIYEEQLRVTDPDPQRPVPRPVPRPLPSDARFTLQFNFPDAASVAASRAVA